MGRITLLAAILLVAVGAAVSVMADVPTSMNVQGRLLDDSGNPLPTGRKDFAFRILDGAGKQVWPGSGVEQHSINTDDNGLWNVLLGSLIPIPATVFADSLLWLEVTVNDGVNPKETFPLVRLATGPYAFRAAASGIADSARALTGGGGTYLPLAGGTMVGPIINSGDPSITMGKANFGTDNTNPGAAAFVAGESNDAIGDYSTVAGGEYNEAWDEYATVGGGFGNFANGRAATVAGGGANLADSNFSFIGGGSENITAGVGATIGGGAQNRARGYLAVIAGGGGGSPSDSNSATGIRSVIGGGYRNSVRGDLATVGGGSSNLITYDHAVIAGGENNEISGEHSVIGGGKDNHVKNGYASTIAGGDSNTTFDDYSTVGGGSENYAAYFGATVSGGTNNIAGGVQSAVLGGGLNAASGGYTVVGGGIANIAHGQYSMIGGGKNNKTWGRYAVVCGGGGDEADGDSNVAHGACSVVPGGRRNYANGDFSFAAGFSAKAEHYGSFVWADSNDGDFASSASNQFLIRASGGMGIGSNDIGTTTVLEVADGFEPSYVEMVRIQSTADPTANDDLLTVEVPIT
ncbi:MAG: hypothetical protein GF341_04510, partial [candidate division Zixibacteria bacterium]|nr:hypothetical protein [candidate division Zixibacteria bacterium]